MTRPIVLPELPENPYLEWSPDERERISAHAISAVELDRRGIVVTDEDVVAALHVAQGKLALGACSAILESFAARLRGTP